MNQRSQRKQRGLSRPSSAAADDGPAGRRTQGKQKGGGNNGRRSFSLYVPLVLCALYGAACSPKPETPETASPDKPVVYTVNYPLQYFAERIGGDLIDVAFPGPPDEDPAYWKPDAETVVQYQQADLVLLNGAGYAGWLDLVSLPSSTLVDTSGAFTDPLITLEQDVTHTHGPGGEHAHGDTAFTTWLDPQLGIEQARAVHAALVRLLPKEADAMTQRLEALIRDLASLDEALEEIVSANPSQRVIFSHPVYQYLERRYGLNARSVHWEPDVAPGEEQWKELRELLEAHPATWMIWEGEPLPDTGKRLEEAGIQSIVFNPCGNVPEEGDFLTVMQENRQSLLEISGSGPVGQRP